MSIVTNLLIFGGGTVVGIWILTFVVHRGAYKYRCQIAIPVGESKDDVLWVADRFKTKKKQGHTQVMFYKNRGKVYAPPYKFWNKWSKKPLVIPMPTDQNPYANYGVGQNDSPRTEEKPTDGWARIDDADIRKHILRGAHFYKVSDEEYKVIKLNTDGNFKVLDHDSTELIIDDIERQNEITTSFKDKLIQLGMWLGSLLVIGLLMITIIVLTFKYAGDQSASIIQAAQAVATSQTPVGG